MASEVLYVLPLPGVMKEGDLLLLNLLALLKK